ncbi:hypothetical protein K439DRAFT_1346631 [Ramaria rubella]|nr:hypothetical protein K439DRAFT_1346631 [Ramaria rubella]
MRGIPKPYTDWIQNKVKDHQTFFTFDGYASDVKMIPRGLNQGCPLSGQFYNSALLDLPNRKNGEEVTAYADNTIMQADGKDFIIANKKINDMMSRSAGGLEWTILHDSHFAIEKSVNVGMTHHREKKNQKDAREHDR